jgi:hypothetical protein
MTQFTCKGVKQINNQISFPAWTGSPAREILISRTHLFLLHDLPPTKNFSPDFEGPFRQLLKSDLVRGMAIWEAGLIRGELLYTDLFRLTIYFLKKNNMFTK